MDPKPFVSESEAPVRWSVRRPPGRGVRVLGWIAALAFALAGAALLRGIVDGTPWWAAALVGSAFGLLIPLFLGGGATARVHADGQLVYGFGHHPNVALPLAAVTAWKPVAHGLLRGIGLEVDPTAVRFLHRKGVSYATMERYRAATGCTLVLEFLTVEDLDRLRALQLELEGTSLPRPEGAR